MNGVNIEELEKILDQLSKTGLRTLVLAFKKISKEEY